MFFNKNKTTTSGFTLIELLVVIAIIGILSSVVLASLNSARSKGEDARTKSQLANMRAQALILGDTSAGLDYSAVCADMGYVGPSGGTELFANLTGASCANSSSAWAAHAGYGDNSSWCVDASGYSGSGSVNGVSCS